jgi:hypothetical protein
MLADRFPLCRPACFKPGRECSTIASDSKGACNG